MSDCVETRYRGTTDLSKFGVRELLVIPRVDLLEPLRLTTRAATHCPPLTPRHDERHHCGAHLALGQVLRRRRAPRAHRGHDARAALGGFLKTCVEPALADVLDRHGEVLQSASMALVLLGVSELLGVGTPVLRFTALVLRFTALVLRFTALVLRVGAFVLGAGTVIVVLRRHARVVLGQREVVIPEGDEVVVRGGDERGVVERDVVGGPRDAVGGRQHA